MYWNMKKIPQSLRNYFAALGLNIASATSLKHYGSEPDQKLSQDLKDTFLKKGDGPKPSSYHTGSDLGVYTFNPTGEITYTEGDLTGERHIKAIYALCETAEELFDAGKNSDAIGTLKTAWGEFEEMVQGTSPYYISLSSSLRAEPSQEQADTAGRLAGAMVMLGETSKLVEAMQHAFKQEQQSPYSTRFQADKKLEDMGYL
jgi:hypothetical protein